MLRLHVAGSVVFCLLTAASVSAQKVDGKGAPYRKWDVQAGVGFHVSVKEDRTIGTDHSWYGAWLPAASGTLEVGRYWTSHLKTEMGVVFLNSHEDGGQETVVVPTGQTAYTFVTSTVRQTQLVFAGTHQFGENDFVHPYLTVGEIHVARRNGNVLALDVNAVKDRDHTGRTLDPSSPNK